MKGYYVLKGLKFLVLISLGILLFGSVVMWLWNCIMPAVFGLGTISFGQAIGLLVLSKIFFGGFKGGHWGNRCCHGHHCGGPSSKSNYWKEKMMSKMEKMSPEQKEKFKAKMQRCGYGFDEGEKKAEE